MDNQCPLCEDQYSSQNPPRLLIGCGHSYCENCFSKIITENKGEYVIICPEDGEMVTLKNNNVSNIPKNIALLKIIESKKNNSSFKDPELQMSKIVKTQQIPHDDDQARDLVDAITSSNSMSLGSEQKINFQKQQTTKGQIQTEKEEQKEEQKPKAKIQQPLKEVAKQKPKQKSKENPAEKPKQKVAQKSKQKIKPKQKEKESQKEKVKQKEKIKQKIVEKEIQKSKSKPKQQQKLKESPKSKPKQKISDKKKEEQVQKIKQKPKQKSKSKPKQKAKQKLKQTPKQNKQKREEKKREEQVQKVKQKPKQKSKSKPKQKPVQKPAQKPKQVKIIQMCKTHQKPLEVVCILDLKKICVNCAIFGDHKGHQFKSLQQIQSERMAYYSAILQIMEKKETINSRISNEQTCHSIMQILENKKTKMKSTIIDKFKKLMDSILFKQKQSLKSLDGLIQKTQTKLKNLMKIDPQVLHKYDSWEQKSYQQIKILEGNNFQAKLQLIFADTETIDVLQAGDIIIDQMNRQEENLINQVQIALDNIGTDFNMEIFNHIDSFVEIFDEPKKKKMKQRISKTQSQAVLPGLYSTVPNNRIFGSNKKQDSIMSAKEETSMLKNPNHSVLIVKSQSSQEKKHANILNHEQDLLDIQFESSTIKRPQFVKTEQIQIQPQKVIQSPLRPQKGVVSPSNQSFLKSTGTISNQLSPRTKTSVNQSMFMQKTIEKPTKKKVMTKLKLPDKFDKIIEGILNDQLETADFTNAQLGDSTIISISQLIYGTKTKNVKFIRNKLTDQGVNKLIPYMKGVITLNLSQNLLTQKVLDTIIQKRQSLQSIKSIILSQNKITQRKAKQKVDKLKQLDIVISL